MQLPHQLWRQRGGQLVGDPGGEVALGVAVGDVAEVAAAGVGGRRGHHEACKRHFRKKSSLLKEVFCTALNFITSVTCTSIAPSPPPPILPTLKLSRLFWNPARQTVEL